MHPPAAIPPTAATRRRADAGSAASQSRRSTSPATPTRAGPSGTGRLAEDGLAPLDALPRDLWRFAVALDGVAALDTDERLARVGLHAPTQSRADWPAYQAFGESLWAEDYAGVLFASAARPAGRALCVFRPGHALPGMRAVPPPVRQSTPPAPPRGLRT